MYSDIIYNGMCKCVYIRSLSLIRYLSSKCRASFLKRTQQNRMTRGIKHVTTCQQGKSDQ